MIAKRWLSLAVVAVLVSAPSARAADVGEGQAKGVELSKYLPDDTEIVMGMNLTKLMEAPLVRKHVPTLVKKYGPDAVRLGIALSGQKIDDDALKAITDALGDADLVRKFLDDNKKRVERITIATNANEADEKVFFVVEGDFNKDKVTKFLDDIKGFVEFKKEKAGKHDVYAFKVPGENEEIFFAVADDRTILASSNKEDLVKSLGANRDKPAVRKQLVEVAAKVDGNATFWFAAAPKMMDEYVTAVGSVTITDGIKVSTTITTKDADAAKQLADSVTSGVKDATEELDRIAKDVKSLAAVVDIVKKVTPVVEKNVVKVTVEVPAATIDKMVKDLP